MTEFLSDEQIIARTVSTDPECFGEIVRRWERRIHALCYGMLGNAEDAGDAAQETFLAAFRNLEGFRGEAKVSSWLHRIAVNQCLTKMRKRKARPEASLDGEEFLGFEPENPDTETPLATAERVQSARIVRQAVLSLPVEMRQVIVMKEFEEMTFQEISETLNIPLSTVKSRLYTGLKQLKLKLEVMRTRA